MRRRRKASAEMLVVDASFLMAAFADEVHTTFAQSVLIAQADKQKIAPGLFSWEFSNILWKKHRSGELRDSDLASAGEFLNAVELDTSASVGIADVDVLAQFARTHLLTAYDAAYLDLAINRTAPLATADKDLTRAAVAAGVTVHSPFA